MVFPRYGRIRDTWNSCLTIFPFKVKITMTAEKGLRALPYGYAATFLHSDHVS